MTSAGAGEPVIAGGASAVVVEAPETPAPSVTKTTKTKTEGGEKKVMMMMMIMMMMIMMMMKGGGAGTPQVPCPHCDKKFMRGYNMRVHIERVHNKSKPWQCQFCEKTFATTSDLKQHLSSHGMGKIHKVTQSLCVILHSHQ